MPKACQKLREFVEQIARLKTEDEYPEGEAPYAGDQLEALDGLIFEARKLLGEKPRKT